ncbi:unnamed protein product, partial [Phaeothamnion confervicola]
HHIAFSSASPCSRRYPQNPEYPVCTWTTVRLSTVIRNAMAKMYPRIRRESCTKQRLFIFHCLCSVLAAGALDQVDPDACTWADRCKIAVGQTTETQKVQGARDKGLKYFKLVGASAALPASLLVASIEFGAVELFATADGRQPTPSDNDWSSALPAGAAGAGAGAGAAGRDILWLERKGVSAAVTELSILVRPTEASQYRLLVASIAGPVLLKAGLPQRFALKAGAAAAANFTYVLPKSDNGDGGDDGGTLVVSLTPAGAGGVDLFVDGPEGQAWRPGGIHGLHSAEVIEIDYTSDDVAAGTSFTVMAAAAAGGNGNGGVGGNGGGGSGGNGGSALGVGEGASFVVCVEQHGDSGGGSGAGDDGAVPTHLLGGLPLETLTAEGAVSRFLFDAPAGAKEVTVHLGVHGAGDPDLLVETGGFSDGGGGGGGEAATWWGTAAGGDEVVTVTSQDDGFLADGGRYYISVVGTTDSEYAVTAYAGGTLLTLREGIPLADTVPEGAYHYYAFEDNKADEDLVIVVTPLDGDPDVFVGCELDMSGSHDGRPSSRAGHFAFSSRSFSVDTVVIAHDDPASCAAGGGKQRRQRRRGLKHGGSSLNSEGGGGPSAFGDDGHTLVRTSGGGDGSVFYLAVLASEAARFTVLATHSGGVGTLTPGVPQHGRAYPGVAEAFRVWVGASPHALRISLACVQGDADLYVGLHGQRATSADHDYSYSSASLTDQVTIPVTEICVSCWVTVGVEAFLTPVEFIVTAAFTGGVSVLAANRPSAGRVGPGGYAYFQVMAAAPAAVSVTLTQLSGRTVLLLSKTESQPLYNASDPAVILVEPLAGAASAVPQATVNVSAGEKLHVGVYGLADDGAGALSPRPPPLTPPAPGGEGNNTGNDTEPVGPGGEGSIGGAEFTVLAHMVPISATVARAVDALLPGQPQDGIAAADRCSYYQVKLDPGHGRLDFIAVPRLGDVVLYVQRCHAADCSLPEWLPTAAAHNYSSTDGDGGVGGGSGRGTDLAGGAAGAPTVAVMRTDEKATTYNVCVMAASAAGRSAALGAHFSLVVREAATILALVPGRTVRDYVPPDGDVYFKVMLESGNATLSLTLTPDPGADPDLFVSATVPNPSPDGNFTWKSSDAGADTLVIGPSDDGYCSGCVYYVGVHDYGSGSTFSIVANVRGAGEFDTTLRPGVPLHDSVGIHAYNRYEFLYDGGAAEAVVINVQPTGGDADLFVTV